MTPLSDTLGRAYESPKVRGAHTLGMDIGGTHVTASLADTASGELLAAPGCNVAVDSKASSALILDQWTQAASVALQSTSRQQLAGIGIAMPGPFDYEGGVSLIRGVDKYESLYGMNIRNELKERLRLADTPVLFRNDAQCFLLGEAWSGAAAGCSGVIAITLGTGFGSAFMRDGKCVETGEGVPVNGWFYHVPYRDGIAEDYFSARGLLGAYMAESNEPVKDVRELSEKAGNDEGARRTLETFGTMLGEFLIPFAKAFRPERIVIGGNVARAWNHFSGSLSASVAAECPKVQIVQSKLFESAAVLGAARLPLLYTEPSS